MIRIYFLNLANSCVPACGFKEIAIASVTPASIYVVIALA